MAIKRSFFFCMFVFSATFFHVAVGRPEELKPRSRGVLANKESIDKDDSTSLLRQLMLQKQPIIKIEWSDVLANDTVDNEKAEENNTVPNNVTDITSTTIQSTVTSIKGVCSPNPCKHGICITSPGMKLYNCRCDKGYFGRLCQFEKKEESYKIKVTVVVVVSVIIVVCGLLILFLLYNNRVRLTCV